MVLADAINLPIVALGGFVVFAPLTLVVVAIELLIFRQTLRIAPRRAFRPVLAANIFSTLAGILVFLFQDVGIRYSGIGRSVSGLLNGYLWFSLLLIVVYFAISVLVEATSLMRWAKSEVHVASGRIFRVVTLANMASYLVVGPLYYFSTRPTFSDVTVMDHAEWTANSGETLYVIDPRDHFLKRVRLGKQQAETVVPFPVADFLVADGGAAYAYRGTDGNLYAWRPRNAAPTLIAATAERFLMPSVSMCGSRVAYALKTSPDQSRSPVVVKVFDLDCAATMTVAQYDDPDLLMREVAWSADGQVLYVRVKHQAVERFEGRAPHWPLGAVGASDLSSADLADNLLRNASGSWWSRDDWGVALPRTETRGALQVEAYPFLGARVSVTRRGATRVLRNDYGLLELGLPAFESPTILPHGDEVLLEWSDQVYLLDVERWRLGFVANGLKYVVDSPKFRTSFAK